jgi:hypothetical protein
LGHPGQAAGSAGYSGAADAVVLDFDAYLARFEPQPDGRARARACVLHRVRQGFLDEPEDDELDAGRRVRGRTAAFVPDRQPGRPDPGEQAFEVGQTRERLAEFQAVLGPQDTEQAAGFCEGLPGGARHAPDRSAAAASRLTGSIKPTSTISFAHSTGSRDGTTARVARIIPVAYSPLNSSMPSTPSTSWANKMPTRLIVTPPAAELPAEILYGAPDSAIAAPSPTISTTAIREHHQVERSARSLVHSARMTRTWVTGPATVAGAGTTGAGPGLVPITALIVSLRRGTRCCPVSLA